jgi:hypothetical protein
MFRIHWILVAAGFLMAPTLAVADGVEYVKLRQAASGKVLSVTDNSAAAGARVELANDDTAESQQWKLEKDGDHYKLVNRKSGKVLDVYENSKEEGGEIIQWLDNFNGSPNQRWSWVGEGAKRRLKSKLSGLVLDTDDEGKAIQRKIDEKSKRQLWEVIAAAGGVAVENVQTLKDNLVVLKTPAFENTAQVIPPGKISAVGRIVMVTGAPTKILRRPLYASNGKLNSLSATHESPFPTTATTAVFTDNQIARLKDGSLLALKDGSAWSPLKPSRPWSNELVTIHGKEHKGQRGAILLVRSTDAGATWRLHSTIDFGSLLEGKYGVPRPMDDKGKIDVSPDEQGRHPNGSPRWWVGGGDRYELYACPFTGNVYVSTRVVSGPFKSLAPKRDTLLLLCSRDNGKTWEAIREDLPGWAPLVMTSMPNGRLVALHVVGAEPRVYFSNELGSQSVKPVLSSGFPVYFVENENRVENEGPESVDLFCQAHHPSISRVSTDTKTSRVRIAYQGRNAEGNQVIHLVGVQDDNPEVTPRITPIATIAADSPKDHSAMYFHFIDPDYIDMPSGVKANASVLYWLEAPRMGLQEKRYGVRYVVMDGDNKLSPPAYLSVAAGRPRTWSIRRDLGDYMAGGFFWKDDSLNFFAQWVEPDGIKANVITLPYRRSKP